MRTLTINESVDLLSARELKIGDWNELTDVAEGASVYQKHLAPVNARDLYSFANHLVTWLSPGNSRWSYLQIDNSTCPLDDEIGVFETLVFTGSEKWDIGRQHSFLLETMGTSNHATSVTLSMLVYFALAFEWHVYITCEQSQKGQRLGLLDGVAYIFGHQDVVQNHKWPSYKSEQSGTYHY